MAWGYDVDFCLFEPNMRYTISADCVNHKHKRSPYSRKAVTGIVKPTWLRGRCIFSDDRYLGAATGKSLLRNQGQQ